jgi:hypothetical protein
MEHKDKDRLQANTEGIELQQHIILESEPFKGYCKKVRKYPDLILLIKV